LLAATLAIAAVASWELYGVLEHGGSKPYKAAGVTLGSVGLIFCSAQPDFALLAALLLCALLAVTRLRDKQTPGGKKDIPSRGISTLVGVVYPSLCLAYWVRIGTLEGGFGYLVFLYALTEINDVAAYLLGGAIGKRKLWPTLSPQKTVEGSLAGALATVALAFPMAFAVPVFSTTQLVGAAFLMAVGGQAGDLLGSWIKRRAGVKDFSDTVPTQGGILDVYDSVVLVSPLFYYYLSANGF